MLGAGFMQSVAMIEAKKLGLRVTAVDGNAKAPCAELADRFEPIDLKDVERLTALAWELKERENLAAVFTTATDFSHVCAKVAQSVGLPSHRPEATEKATNKVRMRQCFKEHGVPSVPFFSVRSSAVNTIEKLFGENELEFPVVVKPADNMGARGCQKVFNFEELKTAVSVAQGFSRTATAIVENFIDGAEYSLEGLIIGDNFFVTAVADRHIYFPPYFVEMGHTIPSRCSAKEYAELISVFEQGVRALGLDYGACKGDIFLSSGKAYVGEIAARLSGGYMSGWTVPYSSGINITEYALLLALGKQDEVLHDLSRLKLPPTKYNTKKFCAERAYISIPGTVEKIYGMSGAKKIIGVKNIFPRAAIGDTVTFPTNNVEKCGNVLAVARSYGTAVKRAERAAQTIVLRLQPHNNETELFLTAPFAEKERKDCLKENSCRKQPNFFVLSDRQLKQYEKKLETTEFITQRVGQTRIMYPCCFQTKLIKSVDVQNRTLKKSLYQLFVIEPHLYDWLTKAQKSNIRVRFWLCFLRGGIQGALYVYDCENS